MSLTSAHIVDITADNIRSLVWDNNTLVDWAGGGRRWCLDGSEALPRVDYAYAFDAALALSGTDYAVIYTRYGTKALLLKGGKIIRELNRSYYFAHTYEYPILLHTLPDGRHVVIHCPDNYCQLEIEELETGQRLGNAFERTPSDVFHSRLAVSPDGKYLLSAGWLWHPADTVKIYNIASALRDTRHLDGAGVLNDVWSDEVDAAFYANNRLIVGVYSIDIEDRHSSGSVLRSYGQTFNVITEIKTESRLGRLMPLGLKHVLNLYGFPQLINLESGIIEKSWPEISCPKQTSSIKGTEDMALHVALDPANSRCAIADDKAIKIITFKEDIL